MKRIIAISFTCAIFGVCSAQKLSTTSFETGQGYALGGLAGQGSGPWFDDSGTGAYRVSTSAANLGSKSVSIDTSSMLGDAWAWQDLSSQTIQPANKILVARAWIRINNDPLDRPPSIFGIDAYSSIPFARMAALRMSPDAGSQSGITEVWIGTIAFDTGLPAPTLNEWHEAILTLDLGNGTAAAAVDGSQVFSGSPLAMPFWTPGSSVFGDVDLYTSPSGYNVGFYDDVRVDAVPRGTLMGKVDLQQYVPPVAGVPVDVEIRNNGLTVDSRTVFLDSEGYFQVTTAQRGIREVVVKAPHWLARNFGARVDITNFGAQYLHVSLLNGDADGDNEVNLGDYSQLSVAFGSDPDSPRWNPDVDFDGDEEITLVDYAILAGNFGLAGD